jgi:hypothetical protein
VPPAELEKVVEGVLVHFRRSNLASAGIPESVPIRITENGRPTAAERPPERQAEILERVVWTVHRLRSRLIAELG